MREAAYGAMSSTLDAWQPVVQQARRAAHTRFGERERGSASTGAMHAKFAPTTALELAVEAALGGARRERRARRARPRRAQFRGRARRRRARGTGARGGGGGGRGRRRRPGGGVAAAAAAGAGTDRPGVPGRGPPTLAEAARARPSSPRRARSSSTSSCARGAAKIRASCTARCARSRPRASTKRRPRRAAAMTTRTTRRPRRPRRARSSACRCAIRTRPSGRAARSAAAAAGATRRRAGAIAEQLQIANELGAVPERAERTTTRGGSG